MLWATCEILLMYDNGIWYVGSKTWPSWGGNNLSTINGSIPFLANLRFRDFIQNWYIKIFSVLEEICVLIMLISVTRWRVSKSPQRHTVDNCRQWLGMSSDYILFVVSPQSTLYIGIWEKQCPLCTYVVVQCGRVGGAVHSVGGDQVAPSNDP